MSSRDSEDDGDRCVHITLSLADKDSKAGLLNKYKTVVAWNVDRFQNAKNRAKRRKVRLEKVCSEILHLTLT